MGEVAMQMLEGETVGAATLGGVRGGMELARLSETANLAIGATSKGVKPADAINMFAPTAFDGVQDALRAATLDFTRGVELRMQYALGAVALSIIQPFMLGAAQYMSEWAAAWRQEQERLPAAVASIGRPVYLPEPEPPAEQIEVVHLPGNDWREVITRAITEGEATPAQLIQLALQYNYKAPGLTPPQWAEIEAVALAYKEHGHKYDSQEAFIGYLIRKGFPLGLATFKRWVNLYETLTGECIRPGRGSRKRKRPFVS